MLTFKRVVGIKEDGYKLLVFPVPCTEYYFVKAFYNTHILRKSKECESCLNRDTVDGILIDGKQMRNYEKLCKAILHNLVIDCAKLDGNNPKFGLYYTKDCLCNKADLDCIDSNLKVKAMNVLRQFPCIPAGSIYKPKNLTFDECINIHKQFIDDYNRAVDKYRKLDDDRAELYRYAKYMY